MQREPEESQPQHKQKNRCNQSNEHGTLCLSVWAIIESVSEPIVHSDKRLLRMSGALIEL